jgi:uncharacterized oligopeptide transporter (OPT) family protein
MKAITEGVFTKNMDWTMVALGGLLGAIIIYITTMRKIRFSIMAFAVGMYLPWFMSTPIMIGGIVKWFVDKRINERIRPLPKGLEKEERQGFHGEVETYREEVHNKGVLFGSGLIAGEALMGVILAALVVSGGSVAIVDGAPALAGLPVFLYMALLLGYVSYRDLDNKEMRTEFRRILRRPPKK